MVVLLALPLLFSVAYLIKQKTVQADMRSRLEKFSLETISVPSHKVVWVKPDKEILVDGKLFDIRSYERKGSSIEFTGLFDKEEEVINEKLFTIATQTHKDSQSQETALLLLLFSPFYCSEVPPSIAITLYTTDHTFPSYSEQIPAAPFYNLLRPPKA